jgi:putative membrane protein
MNHRVTFRLAAGALALAIAAMTADVAAASRNPPPNTAAPATAAPAPGMPGGPPTAAGVTAADRSFVASALSSGMLEVEASRLALERSKHPQLRGFAQRMVDEHSKANDELKSLAKEAGLTDLPVTTMGKYNAMLEKLRALKGAEFEREYAAQIGVASHTEAVALFDQAANDLSNADLKAFAAKLLPQLREHLQQSRAVAKAVGVPADQLKAAAGMPDLTAGSAAAAGGTAAAGSGR